MGGQQLAAILPNARVEPVSGSRTWIMLGQPERTAHSSPGWRGAAQRAA